jgi:hypothetical protein
VGVELLLGLVLNLVILYSTGRGGTAKCLRGGGPIHIHGVS